MIAVLCTMAAVVLIALAGCRPQYEHCTHGPGYRVECREAGQSVDTQHRIAPSDVGGPVRAEASAVLMGSGAPSAPSALVDAAGRQTAAPTGIHGAPRG